MLAVKTFICRRGFNDGDDDDDEDDDGGGGGGGAGEDFERERVKQRLFDQEVWWPNSMFEKETPLSLLTEGKEPFQEDLWQEEGELALLRAAQQQWIQQTGQSKLAICKCSTVDSA